MNRLESASPLQRPNPEPALRSTGSLWRFRIVLLLLVGVLNLPFLFQAFHIDDRLYLEVARQIREEPAFPYRFEILFEGRRHPDGASSSHLPLTGYYLALVHQITGSEVEWAYHLAFLIFPVIAVLSFFEICRRETPRPLAAALLLAVSPGFLTLGHSLMTDVPQLAFWLLALAAFLVVLENPRQRLAWILCAFGLLAASLISLLAAGLVILLAAVWAWARVDGEAAILPGRRVALLLSLPVAAWVVWLTYSYLVYDRLVLFKLGRYVVEQGAFAPASLGEKFLVFVLNLGATVLFPLALWLVPAKRRPLATAGVLVLVVLVAHFARFEGWAFGHRLLFGVFLVSGGLAITTVCSHWRSLFLPGRLCRRAHFLLFCGILAAGSLIYSSGAVRYTLLAAPPVIYFWMRSLSQPVTRHGSSEPMVWISLSLTLLYSLFISLADSRLAGLYRAAASEVVEAYRQPGREVFFTAEWGLRYYLTRAGARVLPVESREPSKGDIIVKPERASPWPTYYDDEAHTRLLETRRLTSCNPFVLLDEKAHAGFYSSAWGLLPVSLTLDPIRDNLYVLEVRKSYAGSFEQPPPRVDLAYRALRTRIRDLLQGRFSTRQEVLVVAKGDQLLLDLLGPNFAHFPQGEGGGYAGYHPADSSEALLHLEQLRARGAGFILFPETSRWWLDYYGGLRRYLSTRARVIIDEPGVAVLYELRD